MSKIFKYIYSKFEEKIGFFITFNTRPLHSANYNHKTEHVLVEKNKFALVLQGPVILDHDFTLETIKIYKKIFPNSIIILSTWDDINKKCLESILNEEIVVLLNKKPINSGVSNINFQIVSSLAGIKYAKEAGVEYVLKTRTDQRMYAPNVQNLLIGLVDSFPVFNNSVQVKRIVGVSLNTFKFRPYSLSDMNLFGYIDDMLLFWDVVLDDRKKADTNVNIGQWSKLRLCEVYLVSNFLEKIGHKLSWTLGDYWEVLANNFCVIDQSSLDLYWYKYARFRECRHKNYEKIKTDIELTFADWVALSKQKNIIAPENIINHNFCEEI